jgi:hypothetical protein
MARPRTGRFGPKKGNAATRRMLRNPNYVLLVKYLSAKVSPPLASTRAAASNWHRDYSPPVWRNRVTSEQKREGWEMAVRIEKIIATVLDEAHQRQVEEVMDTLQEGPVGLYKQPPY